MKRDGRGGPNTISWVSKYGSVIVSAYDIGTAEGMNEKGLVVNELALAESDYGKAPAGSKVISLSTWPQYVLDNHATVAEAVADLRREEFRVQTVVLHTGRAANMHLVISDASGDSAVFEYVDGKLVIHHGKEIKVVTNSPTYDKQLAIMECWREAGGLNKSLPGTSRAADRFVRASFLLGALPTEASPKYISGSPHRALRASVLSMWMEACQSAAPLLQDIIRFNEAIDQAVAESVSHYSAWMEQSRNLLLGSLSHDMRSPLHDIVDFNRTNLGLGISIVPSTMDLAELCAQELEQIRVAYPDSRLQLRVDGDCQGSWDAKGIRQLFGNVVTNAIQHGA